MVLRVAMVGCGYFGEYHLNAWKRLRDVELVGVVDASPERRSDLNATHDDVTFYASLDVLLASHKIDILDVAAPPAQHIEIIEPLLGKINTIICQKPFCGSLEKAKALTDKARTSSSVLVVHENFRFMPWYRAIKQLIEAGRLGTIRQAQFKLRPGDGCGEDAYLGRQPYFRDMERFLIHETGIHWIDTFRYLFGEPSGLYADVWRENPVIKGEDAGILIFTFEDDKRIIFDANRTLDHAADNHRLTMGEFTVEGSEATLYLDGFGALTLRQRGETRADKINYNLVNINFGGDCVHAFQEHVVKAIISGESFETEASDYLTNMRIEEMIYRSAELGQRIIAKQG